ncbi:hypothetical protein ACOI1H_21390 [Loktanella sp. DJP18]|uniref:hypothetical protein n=1 Tax=Loktanella sp. DJP18 TaxID=3409788 RepID=UPI003BB64F19
MSEALGAYRDLDAKYGQAAAVIGSADVYAAWDAVGARLWLDGFDDLADIEEPLELLGRAEIEDIAALRHRTDNLIAMKLSKPPTTQGDADSGFWERPYGAQDGDAASGGYPFSRTLDLPQVPRAPRPGDAIDDLDLVQVRLASRIKTRSQIANSIWWQGSDGFEKNAVSGGFNPTDLWQSIAFSHAGQSMAPQDFTRLASGLADVLRDAAIATWRVKYRDWSARPNMRVGKIGNAIGNPPFPGYVSGHATMAAAAAMFLAHEDPRNARAYRRLADDSQKSRVWGGVHMMSDNDAGMALGRAVARTHLGLTPDQPQWWGSNAPMLDAWLLEQTEDALDTTETAWAWLRGTLFGSLSFHEVTADLPDTLTRKFPVEVHDVYAGSIAMADLDGDGLKEALVSGRDEISLYDNTSGKGVLAWKLMWRLTPEDVSGAYFTHGRDKAVDGILAFGQKVPLFYARRPDGDFDLNGVAAEGLPSEDFSGYGIIFLDADGDGDEDALLVQSTFDHVVHPTILLSRTDNGFVYVESIDIESGSASAGGYMDINDDGVPDQVLIKDYGLVQVIDGTTGELLPLAPEIENIVFGMSFTPIRVDGRAAFHVTNIFDGPDWPYGDPERPHEIEADLLIAWDEQKGQLVDIAKGKLQYGGGEWSWGSAAGDLNGDGLEDLVVVNGFLDDSPYGCNVRIFLQQPGGKFEPQDRVLNFGLGDLSPRSVALDDLDGDGDLDIIVNASQQVRVWENMSQITPKTGPIQASETRGYLTQIVSPVDRIAEPLPTILRPVNAGPVQVHAVPPEMRYRHD